MHLIWFLDCTTELDYGIQIAALLYHKEIEGTQSQESLKLYINTQIQDFKASKWYSPGTDCTQRKGQLQDVHS